MVEFGRLVVDRAVAGWTPPTGLGWSAARVVAHRLVSGGTGGAPVSEHAQGAREFAACGGELICEASRPPRIGGGEDEPLSFQVLEPL